MPPALSGFSRKFSKTYAGHDLDGRFFSWGLPICAGLVFFAILRPLLSPFLSAANSGGDGGDFLAAVLVNGVPHPSGYPTYLLWAGLLQHLPGEQATMNGALASLIPASVAVTLLAALLTRILNEESGPGGALPGALKWFTGPVAAFGLGVTPLFAGQAVIVEVYSLHAFFCVLALWLVALLLEGRWRSVLLPGLAYCYGLGMGVHLTLLVFAPVFLYSWWVGGWRAKGWRPAAALLGAFGAGLLVYGVLPLRAAANPAVNWGNAQTVPGFFWLVRGGSYQGLVFGVQPFEVLQRLGYFARLLVAEFNPVGVFLALFGLIEGRQKRWNWVLGWLFLISLVYALGYNTNDSYVYLIPVWIGVILWIAMGIPVVWSLAYRGLPVGKLLAGLFLILVVFRIPATRNEIDPRQFTRLAQDLEQVLTEAPQNAILVTNQDLDTFPLWYAHFGLKQRPDVRIVCVSLLQFDWYPQVVKTSQPDVALPAETGDDFVNELQKENPTRPVCSTRVEAGDDPGLGFDCPYIPGN
jgi:hypothetical protein